MHTEFEIIFKKNPEKISRKNILEPIAEKLNIEHKKFKNRTLLVDEIKSKLYQSEFNKFNNIQNTTDFATLEPIQSIPKERIIFWSQNNKQYAADVQSLYNWISKGNKISPYAIDTASGVAQNNDPDKYEAQYSLYNVPDLITKINSLYKELNIQESKNDDVPLFTKLRFQIIEQSFDMYIESTLNYFESLSPKDALRNCIRNLESLKYDLLNLSIHFENIEQSDTINSILIIDYAITKLFSFHNKHPFVYLFCCTDYITNFITNESLKENLIIKFWENFE